ncbi:MAG: hypothetical protein Q9227_008395 [Pyrenula ochraceoflavens]
MTKKPRAGMYRHEIYQKKELALKENDGRQPRPDLFYTGNNPDKVYTTSSLCEHDGQTEWSSDRLPEILFYLITPVFHPLDSSHEGKVGCLMDNGSPVLNASGKPLKDFKVLPRFISLDVPAWMIEAWRLLDPRITYGDIIARMDEDPKWGYKRPSPNTLQQRCSREFRRPFHKFVANIRRGITSREDVRAIERLTQLNIDFNTTLGPSPECSSFLSRKRLVKNKDQLSTELISREDEIELGLQPLQNHDFLLARTATGEHASSDAPFKRVQREFRESVDEAIELLFILQERARAHGLPEVERTDKSAWESLPDCCLPAEWQQSKRQPSVKRKSKEPVPVFEGCDACEMGNAKLSLSSSNGRGSSQKNANGKTLGVGTEDQIFRNTGGLVLRSLLRPTDTTFQLAGDSPTASNIDSLPPGVPISQDSHKSLDYSPPHNNHQEISQPEIWDITNMTSNKSEEINFDLWHSNENQENIPPPNNLVAEEPECDDIAQTHSQFSAPIELQYPPHIMGNGPYDGLAAPQGSLAESFSNVGDRFNAYGTYGGNAVHSSFDRFAFNEAQVPPFTPRQAANIDFRPNNQHYRPYGTDGVEDDISENEQATGNTTNLCYKPSDGNGPVFDYDLQARDHHLPIMDEPIRPLYAAGEAPTFTKDASVHGSDDNCTRRPLYGKNQAKKLKMDLLDEREFTPMYAAGNAPKSDKSTKKRFDYGKFPSSDDSDDVEILEEDSSALSSNHPTGGNSVDNTPDLESGSDSDGFEDGLEVIDSSYSLFKEGEFTPLNAAGTRLMTENESSAPSKKRKRAYDEPPVKEKYELMQPWEFAPIYPAGAAPQKKRKIKKATTSSAEKHLSIEDFAPSAKDRAISIHREPEIERSTVASTDAFPPANENMGQKVNFYQGVFGNVIVESPFRADQENYDNDPEIARLQAALRAHENMPNVLRPPAKILGSTHTPPPEDHVSKTPHARRPVPSRPPTPATASNTKFKHPCRQALGVIKKKKDCNVNDPQSQGVKKRRTVATKQPRKQLLASCSQDKIIAEVAGERNENSNNDDGVDGRDFSSSLSPLPSIEAGDGGLNGLEDIDEDAMMTWNGGLGEAEVR